MPKPTINSVALTYFKREGSINPEERIPRFMNDYNCGEEEAKELISIMNMLTMGCFQEMREAAHTGKSETEAGEKFLNIVSPQLSDEARAEIMRYASWCVSK